MHSFSADPATSHYTTGIHPALTSFADECLRHAGAPDRLCVTLALIAMSASISGTQLPSGRRPRAAAKGGLDPGRALGTGLRRQPVRFGSTKQTLTRSSGIPRAAARMSCAGPAPTRSQSPSSKSTAPAANSSQRMPAMAEIAARIDPEGVQELEAAGVIDSKFGTVTLLRLTGEPTASAPASVSSSASTSPTCGSPAGRARAIACRPGGPRSPAC